MHVHTVVRALYQVERQQQDTSGSSISPEFAADYAGLLDLLAQLVRAHTHQLDDTGTSGALLAQARQQAALAQLLNDPRQSAATRPRSTADHPPGA